MKLYSNVFGEGKPFLILHGFLGMGDNWKTLGKAFAEQGFEIHLVDQRNHGRSPHSDDFSYDLMMADLYEYCKDHSLDNIILLGHSMGGKTAMRFAVQYPDLVERLIVADIAPKYYPLHHQDILDGLQSLDFDFLTSRKEVDQALSQYVPQMGVRMFLMKNLYWKEKGQLALRMNISSLVANVSEVGVPLEEGLSYSGATLFLKGEASTYIQPEDELKIKEHFPLAQVLGVEKAGHWLHAENPDQFLERVLEFVKN